VKKVTKFAEMQKLYRFEDGRIPVFCQEPFILLFQLKVWGLFADFSDYDYTFHGMEGFPQCWQQWWLCTI